MLLYGCESWALTAAQLLRPEVFHRVWLRQILVGVCILNLVAAMQRQTAPDSVLLALHCRQQDVQCLQRVGVASATGLFMRVSWQRSHLNPAENSTAQLRYSIERRAGGVHSASAHLSTCLGALAGDFRLPPVSTSEIYTV